MTASGTIVYVHGASDRAAGVEEHVRRIRESLAARGADYEVVAAAWGDAVGPRLTEAVLRATPTRHDRTETGSTAATSLPRMSRWIQGAAAGIIALQYLNVNAPRRVRVWATDRLLDRRDGLMMEILGLADVLVYQRSGQAIRDHVRQVLTDHQVAGRPLIALGNSLGGIILVDLLRAPDTPKPDLLVTVGSQSSIMRAIGALDDDGSPPPFQPWLNIYDLRDFLAFVAQPIWPDAAGIRDHPVDLRLGFPEVHGPAYLSAPVVFDAILGHPAVTERRELP